MLHLMVLIYTHVCIYRNLGLNTFVTIHNSIYLLLCFGASLANVVARDHSALNEPRMRLPTMWYVPLAKAQTSLYICEV